MASGGDVEAVVIAPHFDELSGRQSGPLLRGQRWRKKRVVIFFSENR